MVQRLLVDKIIINRFFLWLLPKKAETEDKVELLKSAAIVCAVSVFSQSPHEPTNNSHYNEMFPWMKVIESDTDFIILHIHRSTRPRTQFSHWLWWLWQSLGAERQDQFEIIVIKFMPQLLGNHRSIQRRLRNEKKEVTISGTIVNIVQQKLVQFVVLTAEMKTMNFLMDSLKRTGPRI